MRFALGPPTTCATSLFDALDEVRNEHDQGVVRQLGGRNPESVKSRKVTLKS